MLIRPFDSNDDRLAIIEKRGWKFDCIVATEEQFGDDADLKILHVDVPLSEEEETRSAIVLINEAVLIDLTKRVIEMESLYFEKFGEPFDEIYGSEPTARTVFIAKRRAVSVVLEGVLDQIDTWISDKEYEDDPNK